MYRRLVSAIVAAVSLMSMLSFSSLAYAVDITNKACEGVSDSAVCKDAAAGKTDNPLFGANGALTKVISIISLILGIIAIIILVVSGIRFALSQGDPSKVNVIRNTITYAIVGVVVAALAQALVNLVLKKL